MTRYDRIILEFAVEFEGPGTATLELGPGDQADPRLLALAAWIDERLLAAAKAAGPAQIGIG